MQDPRPFRMRAPNPVFFLQSDVFLASVASDAWMQARTELIGREPPNGVSEALSALA